MSVKIITDSTSYIDEKTQKELGIKILPLHITFDDTSILETEIGNKEFYEKMDIHGIPLTSQPSIPTIHDAMVDVVKEGDDLLCVFLSSKMSGTYDTAWGISQEVLGKYPEAKIEVIDSKTNSMQLGFAAIVGARAAKKGLSLEEVKKEVEENLKRSRFIFIPENLKYLKKGGRIGGAAALLGNLVKIIPILTVKDGKANILKSIRTKTRAGNEILKQMMEDHSKYSIEEIIVHHINSMDEAKIFAEKIYDQLGIKPEIMDIGPVIGVHVGPGAIGMAYYTRKEMV